MAESRPSKQPRVTSFFGPRNALNIDRDVLSDSELDETSASSSSECTSRKR